MWGRIVHRANGERGMTLVELLVAMLILGIVVASFTAILGSVQTGVTRQDSLSQTLDQSRLALEQLDREMRSGNVLYDPALENAAAGTPGRVASCTGCIPGDTLRVYTQTNADTRGTYQCVLWKIAGGQIMTRSWPPLDPDSATPWRIVATGIVNQNVGQLAYTLDPDPLKGGRTLDVVYAANSDITKHSTQTTRIQGSFTGRNTSYGYPANVCLETPSG